MNGEYFPEKIYAILTEYAKTKGCSKSGHEPYASKTSFRIFHFFDCVHAVWSTLRVSIRICGVWPSVLPT